MKNRDSNKLLLAIKRNAEIPTNKVRRICLFFMRLIRLIKTRKTRSTCPPSAKPGWKIVFCDEFDDAVFSEKNHLNPSGKWETFIGGTHGTELQYYTRFDKNVTSQCDKGGINHDQSGGTLKIITKWEPGNFEVWHWNQSHVTPSNPTGFYTQCEPFKYTSGWIATPNTFLYGYFEIRCKIPNSGLVLWPAFWLWEGGGDEEREIDIFEFGPAQTQPNVAGFNMHLARGVDNGSIQNPSDPINHYPSSYSVPSSVTTVFHKYAVKWSPNSVIWYVDDIEVYKVIQHTPHLDMRLIANMAIASWWEPTNHGIGTNAFPFEFEIDFIRVYQSLNEEFIWQWSNGGNGQIDGWNMNQGDIFIAGDFNQDGRDEILAIAQNGWSKLLRYDGTNWVGQWHNGGNGQINGWNMNQGDIFIAGDFNQDGRDEILTIAQNGWSKLLRYDGTNWIGQWHNGGNGQINGWNMSQGDIFIAGDFNQDGRDEILAIAQNGWSKLLRYDGTNWIGQWHNDGGKTIHLWHMKPSDIYIGADFKGDAKATLLAVSTNGWIHMIQMYSILQY